MNILVIGSGGREHALVWKLRQSPQVKTIFCAPGNAGIEYLAKCIALKPTDIKGLLKFAKEEKIDLTVVGSEQPLVDGIVDAFKDAGLKFSVQVKLLPNWKVAKSFQKILCCGITFQLLNIGPFVATAIDEAKKYINIIEPPMVVKADGLAAGKGVSFVKAGRKPNLALDDIILNKAFGSAGDRIVIEEFLNGEEASLFVLTDGEQFAIQKFFNYNSITRRTKSFV